MRIASKVVIRMSDSKIISRDSYEYLGPVDECKGGGGQSGEVDYPTYMKTAHNNWLDDTGTDTLTLSVTAAMEAAHGESPFENETAYNPGTELATAWASVTDFDTYLATLTGDQWEDAVTSAAAAAGVSEIADSVIAHDEILTAQMQDVAIPKFKAGMLNINAIMTSAFPIGLAIMNAYKNRDVAKFGADIRTNLVLDGAKEIIKIYLTRAELEKSLAHMAVEAKRIHIVARKEALSEQLEIDEKDALWDLEVFQYGGNILASIGGGTLNPKTPKGPSTAASVIGGALSGAAAGAMVGSEIGAVGGPMGAGIGAMLGIGAGLL